MGLMLGGNCGGVGCTGGEGSGEGDTGTREYCQKDARLGIGLSSSLGSAEFHHPLPKRVELSL